MDFDAYQVKYISTPSTCADSASLVKSPTSEAQLAAFSSADSM
ncbi:hypothetical protein [Paraclostridium sp.]